MNSADSLETFKVAIREADGSKTAVQEVIEAETQELFGCSVKELYRRTGSVPGERSTLPLMVQLVHYQ